MLGRPDPQLTFADLQGAARVPQADLLRRLQSAIDWPPIDAQLRGLYPSARGRPSHHPLMLFRALILQRWFKLSDPGLEAQLRDRLSWQYFCGLSLIDPIPDETTFCRFRRRLHQAGLGDSMFQQVEAQITAVRLGLPG